MLSNILTIGSYGFIIVVCSMLFMFAGLKLDIFFDTSPSFMLGLFILAILLTIGKLYDEVKKIMNYK